MSCHSSIHVRCRSVRCVATQRTDRQRTWMDEWHDMVGGVADPDRARPPGGLRAHVGRLERPERSDVMVYLVEHVLHDNRLVLPGEAHPAVEAGRWVPAASCPMGAGDLRDIVGRLAA